MTAVRRAVALRRCEALQRDAERHAQATKRWTLRPGVPLPTRVPQRSAATSGLPSSGWTCMRWHAQATARPVLCFTAASASGRDIRPWALGR